MFRSHPISKARFLVEKKWRIQTARGTSPLINPQLLLLTLRLRALRVCAAAAGVKRCRQLGMCTFLSCRSCCAECCSCAGPGLGQRWCRLWTRAAGGRRSSRSIMCARQPMVCVCVACKRPAAGTHCSCCTRARPQQSAQDAWRSVGVAHRSVNCEPQCYYTYNTPGLWPCEPQRLAYCASCLLGWKVTTENTARWFVIKNLL